jgi:ATP-dependent Clp protease ATP-binding subunit ClpC
MEADMFERYTEKARRVIFFARYEASMFGASQIEAEHILLGLIREDKGLFKRFIPGDRVDVASIRKAIEQRTVKRDSIANSIDLPLSSESKRVLAFAAEESDNLGCRHIGTEHLLSGLLRIGDPVAAEILLGLGLEISQIRQDIVREEAAQTASREFIWHKIQRAEISEKWMDEVLNTCLERRLLTKADLVAEFERVSALRQFRADVEALLRLLAAKGLADPERLLALVFELRDENRLAEFIEKLKEFETRE